MGISIPLVNFPSTTTTRLIGNDTTTAYFPNSPGSNLPPVPITALCTLYLPFLPRCQTAVGSITLTIRMRLLLLPTLLLLPAPTHSVFSPSNRDELKAAVNEWVVDPTQAPYGHISDWDVSAVNDMSKLFCGSDEFCDCGDLCAPFQAFDDDISKFDISAVTNTEAMFFGASSFNGNLLALNMSAITSMALMFNRAHLFNSDHFLGTFPPYGI